LFILFYEGLSEEAEHRIQLNLITDWKGNDLSVFGEKYLSYLKSTGGWYMNRFAREPMLAQARQHGAKQVTLLDASNRPYRKNESVLHIEL